MSEELCGSFKAVQSTFEAIRELFTQMTKKLADQEQMLDDNRKLTAQLVSEFCRHTPQARDDAANQMASLIFKRMDDHLEFKERMQREQCLSKKVPLRKRLAAILKPKWRRASRKLKVLPSP